MSRNLLHLYMFYPHLVTSREGRVSRNHQSLSECLQQCQVTSREGRVSRNENLHPVFLHRRVTSREGRVSRNADFVEKTGIGHMSRPARDV